MDKSGRILIVDDERYNIKVLAEVLRNDYKIIAAKTGEQALAVVQGPTPPDLILLDIMMPEMDGYEVCQRLKNDSRSMHIPVIFISALDASDDECRGFELGAVDYITKPVKPVIVKARVRTHIQLKQKSDLLERMASIDGLTEIPNRRKFDDTLKRELRRSARKKSPLSLILMDIDFFKKFNDSYGHAEGDDCLRRVAKALSRCMQRASDFVARYGGEEFAAILPDTDNSGAVQMAGKIRLAVAHLNIEHTASTVADHVSISLGVATIAVDPNSSPVALIKTADKSLYKAKENGRNRVVSS